MNNLEELNSKQDKIFEILSDLEAAMSNMEDLQMDIRDLECIIEQVENEEDIIDKKIKAIQNRCTHKWEAEYGGCHYLGDYCRICGRKREYTT